MKFTWGTGIFIFIILFVIAGISFVMFTLTFDVNLVHPSYYEKGVNHSEQMAINAKSKKFTSLIKFTDLNNEIKISFPEEIKPVNNEINVYFYRPSDRRLDIKYTKYIKNLICTIPEDSLFEGRYVLKIDWQEGEEIYHIEKNISIKK